MSSEPIQGNFVITCPDEQGNPFSTNELSYDHWVQGIDFHMQLQIPHLQFKIYVRNLFEYQYKENGVAFAVLFQDYHGDAPECTISSGTTTPLTGNAVVFETETIREYGQNLMFEPVPLSMLYTDAQQPQVLLTVNGIEGVCPEFNCDYIYVSTSSLITSQSLSGSRVTVGGVDLPTSNELQVKLSNAQCSIVSASSTQITCDLDILPAAGSWNVKVTDEFGLIPLDTGVALIDIGLTIDSVAPQSGLN